MKIENQQEFTKYLETLDIGNLERLREILVTKENETDKEDKLFLIERELDRKIKRLNYMKKVLL